MKPKLLLCLALILSGSLFSSFSSAAGTDSALRVSSDFAGGSAKVLNIDQTNIYDFGDGGEFSGHWDVIDGEIGRGGH